MRSPTPIVHRSPMVAVLAGVAALAALPTASGAQIWDRLTNPKTEIVVTHPPRVVLAGITKVSVVEFSGPEQCGAELAARFSTALESSDRFELIDRMNFSALIREQKLQTSGMIDPATAVQIGKLTGPAALFTGQVSRCVVERSGPLVKESKDRQGRINRTYTQRAVAQVVVRINLLDVTTGRVVAADLIDVSDTLSNSMLNRIPEAPSPNATLTKAYDRVLRQMSAMVLPWEETLSIVLYNDDKCGLKASAELIKQGVFDRAAESLAAAEAGGCAPTTDATLLAKVRYNIGIAKTYAGYPEDGLASLKRSASYRKSEITTEAIAAVEELLRLEARREQMEAEAQQLGGSAAASAAAAAAAPAAKPAMTNQEVIDLVKAKMGDLIVINQINAAATCKFDTTTPALIALKQAGASDAVILEVTKAAQGRCK